jgi:hypothetical protein
MTMKPSLQKKHTNMTIKVRINVNTIELKSDTFVDLATRQFVLGKHSLTLDIFNKYDERETQKQIHKIVNKSYIWHFVNYVNKQNNRMNILSTSGRHRYTVIYINVVKKLFENFNDLNEKELIHLKEALEDSERLTSVFWNKCAERMIMRDDAFINTVVKVSDSCDR